MIERILALMKRENMTAKEFTEKLGVNPSTVSEWKKGKTKPSVEHVRKIASMFNVSTDFIINGVNAHVYEITHNTSDAELDSTMLNVFTRLSASHRDAVRDFFYLCLCEFDKNNVTESESYKKQSPNQENFQAEDAEDDFLDFDAFDAALDKRNK